ncbi:MAG: SH3 domain-containing protein, partial [Candidatus Binatia bacterium]
SILPKVVAITYLLGFSMVGKPIDGVRLDAATAADNDRRGQPANYVVNRTAILYEQPTSDSRILRMIRPGTIVHVVESTGDWHRVESKRTDRPAGYIRRSSAEVAPSTADGSVAFQPGIFRVTRTTEVRAAPSTDARTITRLASGAEVQVVGESGGWYRIESETGKRPPGYVLTSNMRRLRNSD